MHTTIEDIKKYRLDSNYSQERMAIELGVSRELYNKIENEKLPYYNFIEFKGD